MSSKIPLINPTKDQIKDTFGNLKTDKQKVSDSDFENPISEDIGKDMALINQLNWINQGLPRKIKQKTQ